MPVSKTPRTTEDNVNGTGEPAVEKTVKKTVKKATKKVAKSVAKTATKTTTKTTTKAAGEGTAARAPSARKASARKATTPASTKSSPSPTEKVTLRGRSVFLVQTTSAGVTVRTAWLSEDKSLREMAAVFPDVNYAIHLIDDLKREVLKHFSQAAKVGVQAIASQRNNKLTKK